MNLLLMIISVQVMEHFLYKHNAAHCHYQNHTNRTYLVFLESLHLEVDIESLHGDICLEWDVIFIQFCNDQKVSMDLIVPLC